MEPAQAPAGDAGQRPVQLTAWVRGRAPPVLLMRAALPLLLFRTALLACALALPAAALAPAPLHAQAASETSEGTLSLSARGEARLAPDMATVTSGVVTRGDTAADALRANAQAMSGVFRELERAGIARRDIQTAQLSINPVYAPVNRDQPSEQRITGYEARNTVSAIVRDLDDLGATIDALVEAGANQLDGVNFAHSDPREARDEARRSAIAELSRLRDLYGEAAGVEIGPLKSLSEQSAEQPRPMAYARMEMMAADASTEVAPGELVIAVTVTGSWALPR
jgi:uncharacterized protein